MDYLVASPPNFLDLGRRPTGTAAPSILSRRINSRRLTGTTPTNATLPASADAPRKFTIGSFLPLPSISASPVCTPTTSISPQEPPSEESLLKGYTTAPSSPSSLLCPVSSPPTWISTPPTPPPKMVRRSVTCSTRLTSPFSVSASFPASTLPHEAGYFMKRSNSVPLMPQRPLTNTSSPRSKQFYSRDTLADPRTSRLEDSLATLNDATPNSSTPRPLSNRSKPLFHIPNDACTDPEDCSPGITDSPERTNEDMSVEGSWSDNESDDSRHSEKAKDDIRKYHALKELLDTEVGYLLDLRALVTVYLRILPTLVCKPPPSTTFSRASSSFTSSPWVNSYSHIHAAALSASSATVSDVASPSLSSSQSREPQKSTPRYLFTSHEVEALTRNAEEILQLHEQFVRELRSEMTPLGFHMEAYLRSDDSEKNKRQALQNTDTAIRVVSTKFATEASRFASYQSFCAGHPEALDLVRKVTSQHPLEWDAFEHRCSSLVSELELCTESASDCSETVVSEELDTRTDVVLTKDRTRAASMSSVEGAVRTLRARASNTPSREGVTFPTEGTRKEKGARLVFIDYMIKPVQRICRYPLILDQLKPSKSVRALFPGHLRSDVDVVVESATQAMRHVAGTVNEARHRQDVAIQSSLIASRISLANPAMFQASSMHPSFPTLTQPFLSSLGTCLLAGSLDVIHDHAGKPSGSNVTAKYLGAFLYLGGYLILVKVSKGKVYEPKQWFPLADFDIFDVDEADAMLPCTIRLSSNEHRFELAAACQREKDAWLSSIRESRNHKPSWINEPTSSLRLDGKGELISFTIEEGPLEIVNGLPTIQSIPEFSRNPDYPGLTESLVAAFGSDTKQRKSPKQDFAWRPDPDPPSRRSSTASVKGIFSPMSSDSETIVIRRYSASARSRVDQGLQDVISQPCLTARSYASINDQELFQAPKATRAGFVRSQSGLSMAGMAKSRLTRHESVRVLRRKSLIDKPDVPSSKKLSSSGQSLMSRRQLRPLTITAMPQNDQRSPVAAQSPGLPSPFSMTSIASPTRVGSSSPVRPAIFATHTPQKSSTHTTQKMPDVKTPMKTSRSLVNGVKELFQSRSSSAMSLGRSRPDPEPQGSKRRTPSSIARWARGSVHRRTRSAPDVPDELFTLPDIQKLPALDFGTPISLTRSPYPCEDNSQRSETGKAPLQQSSLPSTARCHSSAEMDTNHGPTKHLSILQRLKV